MTTKEWKQEILARLDNMTDDELIEVYLDSLKTKTNIETLANLTTRVSQLELQVLMLQGSLNSSPYRNSILPTVSPLNTKMNTWPPNPFKMVNYEEDTK